MQYEQVCHQTYEGRQQHGLIKLNSLIYVFGGLTDTAETYDLSTDTWNMIDDKLPQEFCMVN